MYRYQCPWEVKLNTSHHTSAMFHAHCFFFYFFFFFVPGALPGERCSL